jgi:hypothetical protein
MWYWDEWRVRAEKWWVRKIKWKIVSSEREVNVVFNNSLVWLNQKLYVTPESKSIDVKKLQELFLELK